MNLRKSAATAIGIIALGAALSACGSTSAARIRCGSGSDAALNACVAWVKAHPPTTTTAPPTVIPGGTSLAQFEARTKTQLIEAQPKGFAVVGVSAVDCALPNAWTPGKVFECYVDDANNSTIGTVQVTVVSTQPGDVYDTELAWQPGANYVGNSGNTG